MRSLTQQRDLAINELFEVVKAHETTKANTRRITVAMTNEQAGTKKTDTPHTPMVIEENANNERVEELETENENLKNRLLTALSEQETMMEKMVSMEKDRQTLIDGVKNEVKGEYEKKVNELTMMMNEMNDKLSRQREETVSFQRKVRDVEDESTKVKDELKSLAVIKAELESELQKSVCMHACLSVCVSV